MVDNSKNTTRSETLQSMDLRSEIMKYTKYWPWFLLSVVICLCIAYGYLRYTPKIYNASSKIIIKDSENPSAENAVLSEIGVSASKGKANIQNELAILRSRRLMENTVRNLNLMTSYYAEGQVIDVEIYKDTPVLAHFSGKKGSPYLYQVRLNGEEINVFCEETGETFKGRLNTPIDLGFDSVTFYRGADVGGKSQVSMKFSSIGSVVGHYRSKFNVGLSEDRSSILDLSINDRVPQKAEDILEQIVEEYNQDAIRDNKIIAENTTQFINERLDSINIELDAVEQKIENFKEMNSLINIESESQTMVNNLNQYRQRNQDLNIQLDIARSLKDYLIEKNNQLLPSNLGVEDMGVNELINRYNTLILERNNLLAGSSEKNPLVVDLNKQIDSLRDNLFESLDRLIQNLEVSRSDIQQRISDLQLEVSAVPAKEREFRGVSRPQDIKEQLYLFLLQKREENSISYGVENIKAKIVDKARAGGVISPNYSSILIGAFLAGLFIPFGIIFVQNFLDNKIRAKRDIEQITNEVSVVGQIPHIDNKDVDLIQKNDRSILAEAFRILTTSTHYIIAGVQNRSENNTTIYVTSTVKGEGKTFIAFNLALTLCEGKNRVLIIGADLRNPQLQRYEEGAKVLKGVSDFIVSDDESIKSYIKQSKLHPNLSIVTSGSIPPNPSELLKNYKIDNMFNELKGLYDYIIVDTAPAMLVADTFLINRFADLTLYVARAGYTEKDLLNFALEAKESGKLSNLSFVLNDVKMSNFGYYGNKYGYTYAAEDNDKRKGLMSRFKK